MSCPSFELDDTLGVLLVGTLVSYVLFGVVTIQVYVYYGRFPQDSIQMKSMVGAVWCGEVGHAISFGMAVYTIVITNFGHPERLVHFPNSILAAIFLRSLVSFSVQIFFAFRIYALSRSFWILCICWALSLFRVVPPNVVLFAFSASEPGPKLLQRWGPLFIAIWAASTVNDLLIAGTLVYLLYQRRPNTFAGTTAVVDKLIRWTIETGVVTSIASVIMLGVFVAMRTTFIWLAFFVVIPRLFSNSLLASLNSRAALRAANEPRLPSSTTPAVFSRSQMSNPLNPVEMNKISITTYDD